MRKDHTKIEAILSRITDVIAFDSSVHHACCQQWTLVRAIVYVDDKQHIKVSEVIEYNNIFVSCVRTKEGGSYPD